MTDQPDPSRALDVSPEVVGSTVAVLDAVRVSACESRPEIVAHTGLAKALVAERVAWLLRAGVLVEEGQLASRGGRPAQRLVFAAKLGHVIAVEIGISHVAVRATEMAGGRMASTRRDVSMGEGPDAVMAVVDELVAEVSKTARSANGSRLCGMGVGVAGPVEFATGRTIHPPVHPAWHDLPIRQLLESRFDVPVWVDNEANLMALAEHRLGAARGHQNALVFKLGSWVGAGLISNGQLHRGAQGCAGSLATSAGGEAIAARAAELLDSGESEILRDAVDGGAALTAQLIAKCAELGDPGCQAILDAAAEDIGRVMAVVVDFFNPSVVVVAGGMTHSADALLAKIRQTLYGSALALATRDLNVVRAQLDDDAATVGASLMALDHLFAPQLAAKTFSILAGDARGAA